MPDLATMAGQVADSFGIPRNIFAGLIQQESGSGKGIDPASWNPNLPGAAGEVGLTQIKPSTAGLTAQQLWDPLTNLQAGAKYLADNYKAFGNWTDALRGYNAGTAGAKANPTISAGYAASVLANAGGVAGATTPGTQPAGATTSPAGTAAATGTAGAAGGSSSLKTGVTYGLFILAIVGLLAFGIWGTVRG